MTPSYAKYLRKDVRAVVGADEGALVADEIFLLRVFLARRSGARSIHWKIPGQTKKST